MVHDVEIFYVNVFEGTSFCRHVKYINLYKVHVGYT